MKLQKTRGVHIYLGSRRQGVAHIKLQKTRGRTDQAAEDQGAHTLGSRRPGGAHIKLQKTRGRRE